MPPTTALRAPRENGSILAEPPLESWPELASGNRHRLQNLSAYGLRLDDWRRSTRRELISLAIDYLAQFGQSASFPTDDEAPLILSGHQPELFHPGVWIKNFAVHGLAQRVGGVGLHVIADNDAVKVVSIRVPAGNPNAPLIEHVPFDRWQGEVAFEERRVADDEVFRRFADRVRDSLGDYDFEPMAGRYWKHVLKHSKRTTNLGERLAAGRRDLEVELNGGNLELPLSLCCATDGFRKFAALLLCKSEVFRAYHNHELQAYRDDRKIRSRHHPVSALEQNDDWVESPFWVWHPDVPRRQHLFVRRTSAGRLELKGADVFASIPVGSDEVESIAAGLATRLNGWKIRPRALTTTMFLRLFAGDLFVHGIGGAKYDELGDAIVRRFFAASPPAYATLTATLHLPIDVADAPLDVAAAERAVRDIFWNPDRHLDDRLRDQEPIVGWIERKYELMSTEPEGAPGDNHSSHEERRARFREFRHLNEQLRRYVGDRPRAAERQLKELVEVRSSSSLLRSREFAFCLYPADELLGLFGAVADFPASSVH